MNAYDDILYLPHHRSAKRPGMPRQDRAAQFAPFAALNGYEGQIAEAGRLTDNAAELMEGWAERIDEGLREIRQLGQALITVTYFVPDQRKSGGAYRTVTGRVKRLLEQNRCLLLENGTVIPFDSIYELTIQ